MSDEALDLTNLPAGMVLQDKYRVEHTLGVGGMGVVVAATHLALEAKVAIKFLLPQLVSNELVRQRFLREAKAATRIQSEHIARVFDVGTFHGAGLPSQGVPFMVMEYLMGHDLGYWIKEGKRFGASDAIGFVIEAAEALAQAHKLGIVHRDIKPANLFLVEREEGRLIKVLDFGISKLTQGPDDLGLTKTTTVLGSGLYMSPEQMRSAKSVDHRTDVYSLGVCVYELLSGTQPYTAANFPELCIKVAMDPPTPLRNYRPDISEELASAIAKAYATNIDKRYQTVQEMAAALAPFAAAPAAAVASDVQRITQVDPVAGVVPLQGTAAAGVVPLQGTAAALSASVAREVSKGGVLMWIIAALVVAAAALGGFYLSTRGGPEPAASASASVATAPPVVSVAASATAANSASASAAPSASVSAAPTASATASASASASASVAAPVLPPWVPRPPPPPVVVRPPPPPPPPKLCSRRNPDTGLFELVPCK